MPGFKDGPGEVKQRVGGESCPKIIISHLVSNAGAYSGVKASGVIKTQF